MHRDTQRLQVIRGTDARQHEQAGEFIDPALSTTPRRARIVRSCGSPGS